MLRENIILLLYYLLRCQRASDTEPGCIEMPRERQAQKRVSLDIFISCPILHTVSSAHMNQRVIFYIFGMCLLVKDCHCCKSAHGRQKLRAPRKHRCSNGRQEPAGKIKGFLE